MMDKFKHDKNRPASSAQGLSPEEAVWRLDGSSAVKRSNVSYQDEFFDPVWRYEIRVLYYLMKRRDNEEEIFNLIRAEPLPSEFAADVHTFFHFFKSRPHMFEVIRHPNDVNKAIVRLVKDRACPFLEWKRRLLEYIVVAGRGRAYRISLAEALFACPFPRDMPDEEIELAKKNALGYIVARIPDEVFLTGPTMWNSAAVRGKGTRET